MAAAREMFTAHDEAARNGVPVEEVLGARAESRARARAEAPSRTTRRELLVAGASLAGAAALASHPATSFAKTISKLQSPRIAIVGGGLAGLRCAHLLWTANPAAPIASTIYEANPERIGGRCWTLRDFFADGLITEHGGSFLNTDQVQVRQLAAQLGLKEEVVNAGELPEGEEVYFINGGVYTVAEALADWSAVGYPALKEAERQLHSVAGKAELDAMSVLDWLDSTEIGTESRLGKLLTANTVSENGGSPDDQSSIDLIELLVGKTRSELLPLPGDDERFHIIGGNDQLISGMAAQLPSGAIQQGFELIAMRANSDRSNTLSFATAAGVQDVTADIVVLALPFSTLRSVDLSKAGLSASKREVINTMGMGTNAKIHVELSHKTWPALGYNGVTYTEWQRFCTSWDDCVPLGADAAPALLLGFPGGRTGKSKLIGEAHGTAPAADVDWFLSDLERVFPGTQAAYTGLAYEDHWALDPWVHGAYSYYRVGQATSYGQLAFKPEGRIHFAGEHCSVENEGFLDGAVETGERVALRLMALLA
jgi:monoamine oxidase